MKQEIESQSQTVLQDVIEEFSDVSKVMQRMQSWKNSDHDSYQSAYVSLCLPKIFSPLVIFFFITKQLIVFQGQT